jgi:hypothetical protein
VSSLLMEEIGGQCTRRCRLLSALPGARGGDRGAGGGSVPAAEPGTGGSQFGYVRNFLFLLSSLHATYGL